jgi:hypothetical protein
VAKAVGTVAEEEPVMAQSQAGGGPRRPGWGRPDALTSKGGGGGGGWRPRCRRGGLGSGSVGAAWRTLVGCQRRIRVAARADLNQRGSEWGRGRDGYTTGGKSPDFRRSCSIFVGHAQPIDVITVTFISLPLVNGS